MSKLESAFSKALKEQRGDKSISDQLAEGDSPLGSLMDNKDVAINSINEIVSSRKRISKMQQDFFFSEKELIKNQLIYAGMRDVKLLNIYRTIRTKLLAIANQKNFVTMVTSVTTTDNSSLITANLANVFAFDEAKTAILVDANMRKPALGNLLKVDKEALGLVDYLESDSLDLNKVIYSTGIPRLRVVPGGSARENSTEYLTSTRMKEFIQELLKRYPDRYPIINAPSITDSADARILIDTCDKVLLIVPYGKCTEAEIRAAAQAIGSNKLCGLILDEF